MLEARGIGYQAGSRWLVRGIDLRATGGSISAVIGPNGAGKSTLLRLLSGELKPGTGVVRLHGQDVATTPTRELARRRALLSHTNRVEIPFTVSDVVMMGRFPHMDGQRPKSSDHEIVERSLERVNALDLKARTVPTLSGGERGRVDLARILAQEPQVLLLDEPTHHLDIRHQIEALELCRDLAGEGHAIIVVLHDLNMAAMYAQNLLLLQNGTCVASGTPAEVLTGKRIKRVFGITCRIWTHPNGVPWVVPCPNNPHGVTQ